jgi:hypothetical protein
LFVLEPAAYRTLFSFLSHWKHMGLFNNNIMAVNNMWCHGIWMFYTRCHRRVLVTQLSFQHRQLIPIKVSRDCVSMSWIWGKLNSLVVKHCDFALSVVQSVLVTRDIVLTISLNLLLYLKFWVGLQGVRKSEICSGWCREIWN